METERALDAGIPKTRYTRVGAFSSRPLKPMIDHLKNEVRIYFPLTPRLAYVMAAAYGDGSVLRRRISFYNSDRVWLVRVMSELDGLTTSRYDGMRRLFKANGTVLRIDYPNAALARLIGGSPSDRVKKVALITRKDSMLAAFVAGFFDCEGSVTTYLNKGHPKGAVEVSLANANLGLLVLLKVKLAHLGINGGISISSRPRTSKIDGRTVNGKKVVYRLRFSGRSSAARFAAFILPWVKSRQKSLGLVSLLQS